MSFDDNAVTIIIPVYNAGDPFKETLDSVSNQTSSNWKVIIVDDGSTDRSFNIAERFSEAHPGKCILLRSAGKQSGAASCRNLALQHTKSAFVLFLDADDALEPFCIQQRLKYLIDNLETDVAIFRQYSREMPSAITMGIFNHSTEGRTNAILKFIEMEPAWQTMAPLWKLASLKHLGGFDESLLYMEDPELHLRALLDEALNISFAYSLPPDCFYSVNQMDSQKAEIFYDRSIESRLLYIGKLLKNIDLKNEYYRKALRKGYFQFIQNFVIARLRKHYETIKLTTVQLHLNNILSKRDVNVLHRIFNVYNSKNALTGLLRLRGLAYKWLRHQKSLS